jgi:hypothetical protein
VLAFFETGVAGGILVKNKIRSVLMLVVGIGLLIGAISTFSEDEVTCGSRTMSPGDTCVSTSSGRRGRGGSTTERSYEEQHDSNTTTGWILLGFGSFLSIGGGAWAYRAFGGKRPQQGVVAPNGGWGPGQPQPVSYPQPSPSPQNGAQPFPQSIPGAAPGAPQQSYPQHYQHPVYPQQSYPGTPYSPGSAPGYPQQQYQQPPFPPARP